MSEDSEEACLVRPRSPSTNSSKQSGTMSYTNPHQPIPTQNQSQNSSQASTARGSQSHESESGELILDYNDEVVLSQFHADAIKQAGFGKFQILATVICGLGLAGHAIQVYAVFYILPSAEVEYCILDHEKNWLASITLLGMGFGALFWGSLAGRAGRRKTLLTCLVVSGVFSVIAAFMPTYGPFMMARFCAAAGVGGALPTCSVYLCEITPTIWRARILGILGAFGVSGGLLAGAIAQITVPSTGQMVIIENKEHFSAWHRYLLFSSLPTFASILGLFWLPESPRYLLENSREVEALSIYQKIYRTNRTRGGYSLTELELPGSRTHRSLPSSVLQEMAISINLFFGSFVQLFNKTNYKTTTTMMITWACVVGIYHGLTIYVAEYSKSLATDSYYHNTITKSNLLYENTVFNESLDNVVFSHTRFVNCTFRRMFISHVLFDNCTFVNTEFTNVKTSRTLFSYSLIQDVILIDTDLTLRHFKECDITKLRILRLNVACDRDFEYNIYLDVIWRTHFANLIPTIAFMFFMGETVHRFGRSRMATVFFAFAAILNFTLGFLYHESQVLWTSGSAQGLMLAGLAAMTLLAIESFTTPLRCTALGIFVCCGHLGALIAVPIYSSLPFISTKMAALLSTGGLFPPIFAAVLVHDPCLLL